MTRERERRGHPGKHLQKPSAISPPNIWLTRALSKHTYLPGRVYKTEKREKFVELRVRERERLSSVLLRNSFFRFRSVYIAAAVVVTYCLHSLETRLDFSPSFRPITIELWRVREQ
jgi:hypothetical protein